VGPDPHRKTPNPWMHSPDLRGEVQDLHRYKPNPWDRSRTPQRGSGPLTVGSRDPKAKNTQALTEAMRGSSADTCSDHTACASSSRSSGDPMLPRGPLPVT
jgi:hypothetical protein